MRERPDHKQRALALGDVAAEVLALGVGVADEVQKVVLQLEGEARRHAEAVERGELLGRAAAHDGARHQRDGRRVVGGLVGRHVEVVLRQDVPAAVADPAEVERLALDGALLHLEELLHDSEAHVGGEVLVAQHVAEHVGESEVADVDGDARALRHVGARLAAAQLGLVGDIVVNEGCRLEDLDGRRRAHGARRLAAHGLAAEQAKRRPGPLAARGGKAGKRRVEEAVEVRGGRLGRAGHAGRGRAREVVVDLRPRALQVGGKERAGLLFGREGGGLGDRGRGHVRLGGHRAGHLLGVVGVVGVGVAVGVLGLPVPGVAAHLVDAVLGLPAHLLLGL